MTTDEQQIQETLRQALARSRLMAEASAALESSMDGGEKLCRLARLVIPQLADACVVDLVEDNRVRRVEVAQPDGAAPAPLTKRGRSFPLPEASSAALARVLRGAGLQMIEDLTPEAKPSETLLEAQRQLYRALGAGSALIVPLQARRQVLGAISFLRHATGPSFNADERELAAELAHRAALSLDNANLYRFQQRTAEELQRSLLPALGGVVPWPLTARYVPARERAEVGGDWYDAFPLPTGATVLAIGDVIGHDLTAAVRMSQLRNMTRALAYDSDDSPAGVMCRLDRVMQGLTSIDLVTAVICRVRELPDGQCELLWSNAGHPPPLLVWEDGESRLLDQEPDPALGAGRDLSRADRRRVLPRGSTLVLYTDGLIERPSEDIGRGLTRLRQQASRLAGEPLEVFCDELLDRLLTEYRDDVALLALRISSATDGPAARTGPGHTASRP